MLLAAVRHLRDEQKEVKREPAKRERRKPVRLAAILLAAQRWNCSLLPFCCVLSFAVPYFNCPHSDAASRAAPPRSRSLDHKPIGSSRRKWNFSGIVWNGIENSNYTFGTHLKTKLRHLLSQSEGFTLAACFSNAVTLV